MKNRSFFLLMLLLIGGSFGCQKQEDADPCEWVLNEGPLKMVGLLLVDEDTGENIVVAGDLDSAGVSVISVSDGKPYTNYQVARDVTASPMNGAVIFYPAEAEAVYLYEVRVRDYGTLRFSYTVSQVETGDACRPYGYPVSEVKVVDRPFEPFEHALLPEQVTLLKVAL